MSKNKLKKFAEMKTFANVFEYPWARLQTEPFPLRGRWHEDFFRNDNPIVLELGCGKGEYTVGLARRNACRNHIGIDVKGARIWSGASEAVENEIANAAFLRGEIESIDSFFAPGEVDEIWITFPDPQMQKTRKRLTSTRFLELYRKLLKPGGVISLKTDSPFLYEYTRRLVELNGFPIVVDTSDLYAEPDADPEATSIKTYYEKQWLSRGKRIKLLRFHLPKEGQLKEPREDDIERDDYRSFPRGIMQGMNPEKI